MRIYKTRYDFENLDQSEIFPGTICTITDEVDNPTYIYQNSIWNAFVTVPQSEEANPTTFNTNSTQRTFPYILAQSGVPVGIAPNGTIATNGAVTLGTALPTTYSGGIWLRFPANAVVGDSTGGIYWCVMSSTTVGTVYAGTIDTASAFTPYIGSTAGGAVTGSNSAYTQDTANITLTNVTVPAGAMGVNGAMRITVTRFVVPNNANSKTLATKYGASFFGINNVVTTTLGQGYMASIRNRGVANKQVAAAANGDVAGSGGCSYLSIDSATDQPMTVVCRVATAADYVILEGFTVEVLPS